MIGSNKLTEQVLSFTECVQSIDMHYYSAVLIGLMAYNKQYLTYR